MIKKIIALVLSAALTCPMLNAALADEEKLLYSQQFSSIAENSTEADGLSLISGVDTRVITDEGSKVLFSRAYGESIKIKLGLAAADCSYTVYSARIKLGGIKTTGKLFSAVYSNRKYDFLTLSSDGFIKLADGKIVSGIPMDCYHTYTIAVDWGSSKLDLYIDQKLVIDQWIMPLSNNTAPTAIDWILDCSDEGESNIYIDDIFVYDGNVLPWETSFPYEADNTEVLDFSPTEYIDTSAKIVKTLEFNGTLGGAEFIRRSGTLENLSDEDGTGYMHMYADKKTPGGSYFDVSAETLANISRYVVDMRLRVNNLTNSASMPFMDAKNASGTWRMGYYLKSSGVVTTNGGSKVCSYTPGEWMRLSFVYNISAGRVSIYKDGEHIYTQSIADDLYPTVFRFELRNLAGSIHDTCIDWIRIYTGAELKGDEDFVSTGAATSVEVPDTSIMDPADKLKEALDGKVVLMTTNDTIYIDGKKQSYANDSFKPYIINGCLMMPRNMYSLFSFDEISFNENSGIIKVGNRAVMKVGSTKYSLNGETKTLNAAPVVQNGVLYFPLRGMAEQLLGKFVTWDCRGAVIISDTPMEEINDDHFVDRHIKWNSSDLIYRYMQFENPTGDEMIAALRERWPDKTHPRLMYTMSDTEYMLDHIETDSEWKKAYEAEIAAADKDALADCTAQYNAGNADKQIAARELQNRMERLVLAYQLTGDNKYAEKGVEILMGLCSWDTLAYSYANLIVGHWGAAVGLGYDAFYNYLSASEDGRAKLKKIRDTASSIAFGPHMEAYSGQSTQPNWITMQDNFIGVCGGSMMLLLLAMADEEDVEEQVSYLLDNVLRSLNVGAGLFFPNGGYYESVGYSSYMLWNFGLGLTALINCCGSDYGMGLAKGFDEAGNFFTYLQSPNSVVNYHDGSETYIPDPIRERWGYIYNDPVQAELGRQQKLLASAEYDLEGLFFYYKALDLAGGSVDLPEQFGDGYFYGTEGGAFKSSLEESNPTFVGFHGGRTNLPHDMLDLGEFLFEADGVKWAIDLGSDDYAIPGYFARTGYNLYRKRPEGKNCLVLNPKNDTEDYYGQALNARAYLIDLEMNKPKGAKAAYDITEAYARDVNKYVRGYYFGDDRNTLTVQDELDLKGSTEIYWFMHTAEQVEILSNTRAKITSVDGKTLTVDVYCSVDNYELTVMDCVPLPSSPVVAGQNNNAGYHKVAIHVPDAAGNVTITVKLSPDTGSYAYTPIDLKPVSEWTIPDGTIAKKASLDALLIDGKPYSGYVEGLTSYTIELPFGAQTPPLVDGISTDGTISVTQANTFDQKAEMAISGEGLISRVVTVKFTIDTQREINVIDDLKPVKPSEGIPGEQIKPVLASGYTIPQKENGPEGLLDGQLATRYAQSGKGMWFELDMGSVMDISGVALSFYEGDKRIANYDVLYSENGYDFVRVFSGTSLGTTNDFESLAIPGRVRYIRIIGNGTSAGNWNSITEFRAYR